MHLIFKVCHAGENRNYSNISKDNLDKYKSTINYRPVLASIVTSPDDASVLDFNSHDIDIDDNNSSDKLQGVIDDIKNKYGDDIIKFANIKETSK